MIRSLLPVLLLGVALAFPTEEGYADGDDAVVPSAKGAEEVPLLPLWERNKPVPVIHWATDPESALKEARDRQVPLWVVVHTDEDPIFKLLSEGTYIDPEFCSLVSREVVPIAIIIPPEEQSGHAEQKFRRTEKGETEHRCPFLRSVRCEAHEKASGWLADGPLAGVLKRRISGYWLLGTDGTILRNPQQLRQGITAKPFSEQIATARKVLGSHYATRTDLIFTGRRIAGVEESLSLQKFREGSMIASVLRKDRKKFGPGIQEKIDEAISQLTEVARSLLDRATVIQRRSPEHAIKILGRVSREFRGFPESVEAAQRIEALQKH